MSASGRQSNNSSSANRSNNERKEDQQSGFSVGAMLFATVTSALIGGAIGYLTSSADAEEAEAEHAQRTVPVQPPTECAVCWEPLGARPLEQLPCSHLFHLSCLTTWLRTADGSSGPGGASSKSCPICRQTLTRRQLAIYQQRCGL